MRISIIKRTACTVKAAKILGWLWNFDTTLGKEEQPRYWFRKVMSQAPESTTEELFCMMVQLFPHNPQLLTPRIRQEFSTLSKNIYGDKKAWWTEEIESSYKACLEKWRMERLNRRESMEKELRIAS